MIEVRKIPNTEFSGFRISSTQLVDVSLFVVFYNGVCEKVYARDEKEAEEKVKMIVEKEGK